MSIISDNILYICIRYVKLYEKNVEKQYHKRGKKTPDREGDD